MSMISTAKFLKFCISQGFEFVLDENNKVINKDNIEELDSIIDKNKGLTPISLRKTADDENDCLSVDDSSLKGSNP